MSPFLKKAKKYTKSKSKKHAPDHHFYNCKRWTDLRESKLIQQPVCEICEMNKRTKLSDHIHHLVPISSGYNEEEKRILAYDFNNLCSICIPCHQELHKMLKKNQKEYYKLVNKIKNGNTY